jgi:hypothetical protein
VAGDLSGTRNVVLMQYQENYYALLLRGGVICLARKILSVSGLRLGKEEKVSLEKLQWFYDSCCQ